MQERLPVNILGAVERGEIHRSSRYVVSRARLDETGAPVIIKAVRSDAGDSAAVSRLEREYGLLAALDLPGVVRPIAFAPVAGRPALILEDAGGQNLEEWLRHKEVSPGTFVALATQLAQALVRLHARDVIHRDINPSNVVIDDNERVTLVDFEAATPLATRDQSGGVPARLGAELSYVAPEETGRMNRLVDQRADLYSLGAVLYEVLTGRPPFVTADPVELVHAHLARTPIAPALANPAVPVLLSELVLRLLAKMPEARYQSARSLLEDLEEARARLDRDGFIAPFELGLMDLERELPFPERLYQRDVPRQALLSAWQAAAAGQTVLAALAGPAGIGKSALACELREPVALGKGHFLAAKLDLQGGRAPYAPFAEAIRGWVTDLVAGPAAETAAWRLRLEAALGENARVIIDIVPELERLMGVPLALPAVGVMEAQSRLHFAFLALMRALASPEHPLVLFLDDLQWADVASLRLLEVLATAPDLRAFLIVLAFRPDEGEAEPAVAKVLDSLARTPRFRRIDLAPLGPDAIVALCGDLLRSDPGRVRPLAALIEKKTAGNPFFIRRMLRFLHQSELLVFDAAKGTWTWDLMRIEQLDVAENVVDLLLVVLQRLPEGLQRIIETASCIGHTVPLGLLASVCGLSPEDTVQELRPAARAGLLVALAPARDVEKYASFRFAHDRIRQAAYLLLGEQARKAIHLRVGRQLLGNCRDEHALDEYVYAIVSQFERGGDLVTDSEERFQLSQLSLRAARKARSSSAHAQALDYVKSAMALLPDDAWQSHRADTFAVHREALQLAGLAGELTLADQLFARAITRTESIVEKADLYNLRTYAAVAQDRREEAFRWGLEGVGLFDIELPLADPEPAITREMQAIQENLAGRTLAQVLEAPPMREPRNLACMELLCTLLDTTYFQRPDLFPFIAARMVNTSLEHGPAVFSAQAYMSYAVMLGQMGQDFEAAHAFGRLSLDLAARFGDPIWEIKVLAVFTTCVNNWTAPLYSTLPLLRSGQDRALKAGETYYASAFSLTAACIRLHQGVELGELVTQLRASIALQRTVRNQRGVEDHLVFLQALLALQGLAGPSAEDLDLAGTKFDERGLPVGLAEGSSRLPEYQILHLGVACLLRDFDRAMEISTTLGPLLNRVPRFVQHVEYAFYTSVTLAARCARASSAEKDQLLAAIAAHQERLGSWASNSPENYQHKQVIVAAEVARLEGKPSEAAALYDQAIAAAERGRFLQDEALANELGGRFYLAQGRRRIAGFYLSAAIDAYARWGAAAKVDALEVEFAEVRVSPGGMRATERRWPTRDQTGGAALDLLALFRAAEAVSSEVMLPRLLDKLMEVCMAVAGAERGAFVVDEEGRLIVRAVGAIGELTSLSRTPVEASPHLPARVVEQVCRTGEALVVGDACAHEQWASDPYMVAHSVRSLLALPILRQARLMGVLYLENNLATRVFTPERVRLLLTLSSQIATSLQNSLLFEHLSQEVEERKRAEAAVRFLAEAGATLAESLEYQSTLKKLTHLVVPVLADWCAVHVVEDGAVKWVAAAHVDPSKQTILEEQVKADIGQVLPRHVVEVLETKAPVLHTEVDQSIVERYVTRPEVLPVVQAIGAKSSMILPLRAQGRFLGALTLASTTPERRFGVSDLAAAEELARRAALAIDNARLYREAMEAIRLRDEFLSIASHELNTPIASLKLVSQTFEDPAVAPSPGDFRKMMDIVSRQSQRLATLVSDLLDVAQIPAGRFKLRLEKVELAALVQETVELFRGELARAKCPLALEAEAGLVGRWDRARLQQVVTNLLSNAIKFAAGKPITVRVTKVGQRLARLTVEDRGMGIPPERLSHIFGRFERAVSANHFGGLGLGLYIVHTVVQALGGTVAVTSVLGQGTTFTIDLPLVESGASA